MGKDAGSAYFHLITAVGALSRDHKQVGICERKRRANVKRQKRSAMISPCVARHHEKTRCVYSRASQGTDKYQWMIQ